MATSKIPFEHPASITLGIFTADDEKEFYRKIIDSLSYLSDGLTGTYRATWDGKWSVYGVYSKGTATWITVIRIPYIVNVLKDGNTYSYTKVNLTAF